jgi:hypothetical protein
VDDLPLVLLCAAASTFLVIWLSAAVVAGHTSVQLPRALKYGVVRRRVGRPSLLLEVPFVLALLGGGELAILAFLLAPESSLGVRVVCVVQLLAAGAWFRYLGGLVVEDRLRLRRPDH